GRGGAERQLSLLARTLHARGVRVAVAVFYTGGALEKELTSAGVPVLDLQKAGRWSNLSVVHRLLSLVKQHEPRVLHSYMSTQNVLLRLLRPWLKRHGCAVVCGIRTALGNAWRYNKYFGVVDAMQSVLLPAADGVISNSERGLSQLRKSVLDGHVAVVP